MADSEQVKKGQTLSGVASGIIIYILAGGTFLGTGNLLVGTVTFKNSFVLEWAFIVFFFYSWYRYCLSRPKPLKDFKSKTKDNLQKNQPFKNYISRVGKEMFKKRKQTGEKKFIQVELEEPSFIWYKVSQPFRESQGKMYAIIQVREKQADKFRFNVEINSNKFWLYGARTWIFKEDFCVILLPWGLSFMALLLIVLRIAFW